MSILSYNITNPGLYISGILTGPEQQFVTDLVLASGSASEDDVLTWKSGAPSWEVPAGGGHTIEDEGTPLAQRTKLNFVGAGVTVTDDSGDDATVVTIGGGAGMTSFTLGADSGTPQTIADSNTLTIAGGTGIDTVVGATDTVTINLDSATQASLALADTSVQDLSDLGITASASELNILDGATLTVTELNYVDGVTSAIQTQLNGKQAQDAFLDDIAALTDPGADRLMFWDDSDGNIGWLTIGSGLDLTGTTLSSSGGGNNYFNNEFIDQSGGTSDTYGALTGTINGSNTTFTVSQAEYASGTLKVYLNGQLQTQGTGEDWVETTPASGTFDFDVAPQAGDQLLVTYQVQELSSDTILTTNVIIDEDNMVSNSDQHVPTQQSVKAYVDAQVGYTDEQAQDAVGGMVDTTLTYTDGTPLLGRAAITGDITISANSNTAAIGSGVIVNGDVNASAAIDWSKMANLTNSRALVSDGSGDVSVATTTATEIGYVNGVTSAIQTQLNAKLAAGDAVMGVIVHGATSGTSRPSGFDVVTWIGSVEPSNATDNDIWIDNS